jgi:DNA-binding response OmpR family regulator
MARPAFIMAEVEPIEGVSARKLVLETAKFNVLTAYSAKEALTTLKIFPKAAALILHASLPGVDCDRTVTAIKKLHPRMPVIVLAPSDGQSCKRADYNVPSYEPQELLNLLRRLFGDPREENGQ